RVVAVRELHADEGVGRDDPRLVRGQPTGALALGRRRSGQRRQRREVADREIRAGELSADEHGIAAKLKRLVEEGDSHASRAALDEKAAQRPTSYWIARAHPGRGVVRRLGPSQVARGEK